MLRSASKYENNEAAVAEGVPSLKPWQTVYKRVNCTFFLPISFSP